MRETERARGTQAPQLARRAEIWTIEADPGLIELILILSADRYNAGKGTGVIALEITDRYLDQPHHVHVDPVESGIAKDLYLKCDEITVIDKEWLHEPVGHVGPDTMRQVEDNVRIILGLPRFKRGRLL